MYRNVESRAEDGRPIRVEAGIATAFGCTIQGEVREEDVVRIAASGNTLIDHAVGAGKTFTMIAAGMEQKRLGLVQRPVDPEAVETRFLDRNDRI